MIIDGVSVRDSVEDIRGRVFNRLTVTGLRKLDGRDMNWVCRCECGNIVYASHSSMKTGGTKSCGCWNREHTSIRARTHNGIAEHPTEYKAWIAMKDRCKRVKGYQGRVSVCDEWMHDFPSFLADIGDRPSSKHSVDRINNNGDYKPGNVRWATSRQQMNNRSINRSVTIRGVTKTVAQWSRSVGLKRKTVTERLRKGWNEADAVLRPVGYRRSKRVITPT